MFVCLCVCVVVNYIFSTPDPLKTIVRSTKDVCSTLLANNGYFGQACTLFYFYSCNFLFCKFKLIKGAIKLLLLMPLFAFHSSSKLIMAYIMERNGSGGGGWGGGGGVNFPLPRTMKSRVPFPFWWLQPLFLSYFFCKILRNVAVSTTLRIPLSAFSSPASRTPLTLYSPGLTIHAPPPPPPPPPSIHSLHSLPLFILFFSFYSSPASRTPLTLYSPGLTIHAPPPYSYPPPPPYKS